MEEPPSYKQLRAQGSNKTRSRRHSTNNVTWGCKLFVPFMSTYLLEYIDVSWFSPLKHRKKTHSDLPAYLSHHHFHPKSMLSSEL